MYFPTHHAIGGNNTPRTMYTTGPFPDVCDEIRLIR